MTVYLELTREFNAGRTRAILSSGQAVVLLRLAIASKDGDWILREDEEALSHVRSVLARHGAQYRFGAPLDLDWLRGGWSAHLEFPWHGLRVRTDFSIRPPRLSGAELEELWAQQDQRDIPFTPPKPLLRIKQTGREKDWPIVGELARLLTDPGEQLLYSRSPQDILRLLADHPSLAGELPLRRPALAAAKGGLAALRMSLDQERYELMDADEARLRRFIEASSRLRARWPALATELAGLPLPSAHERLLLEATECLPKTPRTTDS